MKDNILDNACNKNPKNNFKEETKLKGTENIYSLVSELECGVRRVMFKNKWGVISEAGNTIVTLKYDYIYVFENGYAQVRKNGLFGVIDTTGREIITTLYNHIFDFDGELAIVHNGVFWGAINKKGVTAIPIIFEKEFHFWGKNYAVVKYGGKYNIIDRNGNFLLDRMADEINCEETKYVATKNGEKQEIIF